MIRVSATGSELALLTGRPQPYSYRHVERFLRRLATANADETFTAALARWTSTLWQVEARSQAAPSPQVYVDGLSLPVYTDTLIPRGLIGNSGKILGCRALTLLHVREAAREKAHRASVLATKLWEQTNGFVERYHRTLNQECLVPSHPKTLDEVRQVTDAFATHYNWQRPHQGIACGNRPPRVAFPDLPSLPRVPDLVNPDAWLSHVKGQHLVRRVNRQGFVKLVFYVSLAYLEEHRGAPREERLERGSLWRMQAGCFVCSSVLPSATCKLSVTHSKKMCSQSYAPSAASKERASRQLISVGV